MKSGDGEDEDSERVAEWIDDDPTVLEDASPELIAESAPVTAPHGLASLPGYDVGVAHGEATGEARAIKKAKIALRSALLSVGVEAWTVEKIVMHFEQWISTVNDTKL